MSTHLTLWPRITYVAIAAIFVAFAATARAQPSEAPDAQQIASRGSVTRSRFANESASWTGVVEVQNANATIEVATTQLPTGYEWIVSAVQGKVVEKVAHIIVRDGYWYVYYDNEVRKYRPYEAPLPHPPTYLFLAKSGPKLVTDAAMLADMKFESLRDGVARYRAPLPESARQQLQQALFVMQAMQQKNPERMSPEHASLIPQMRDALERGMILDLNTDTGMAVSEGAIGHRSWIKDFRWLPKADPQPLAAELASAKDCTQTIIDSAASLNDLVMLAHASSWEPGTPAPDGDAVIVNIRNGEIRRVPYTIPSFSEGSFAKDRRSVFISGLVPDAGGLGLFQVDLQKGNFRPIAEQALNGAMAMFPTISPDGNLLALLTRDGQSTNILAWQVCVIDLATETLRKIGTPFDTASLSWLPDQSGLVLVTRAYDNPNSPMKNTIAKMDLNGQITPLRRGAFPIVIPEQQRILFLGEDDRLWRTCDMAGQNETMVGDGLKEFCFPALSPDGKQLLIMRFAKSTGPRPYIVDLASGEATALSVGKGFWGMPTWR